MSVLLAILAILFATLLIGIPLIEKYSSEKSDEELSKISKYLMPLMLILMIGMGIRYLMG